MRKTKQKIERVEVAVLFTKEEYQFLNHLSRRSHLTKAQMIASVMRRHIKSRYQFPRREWHYVFGK